MARFFGEVTGGRGTSSRIGNVKSGMVAHIRGWNIGVRVECRVDEHGNDQLSVFVTGGSNKSRRESLVSEVSEAGVESFEGCL